MSSENKLTAIQDVVLKMQELYGLIQYKRKR